jgi:hypothetical protein
MHNNFLVLRKKDLSQIFIILIYADIIGICTFSFN